MSSAIDLEDKCFKALYRFCCPMDANLPHSAHTVCISDSKLEKLCGMLGRRYYTRLVISDGVDHEIVLVENSYGDLVIHRAQEGTSAKEWRCGSMLTFEWTPCNMLDQRDLADKEAVVEEETKEECGLDDTLCWGNYDLKVEKGRIVKKECVRRLPRGCTYNTAITWNEDGCPIQAAEGKQVAVGRGCPTCKT